MNTTLEEQLEYAKAMLEVLDPSLKLMKPEFRHAAARQLVYVAEQIAATMSLAEAVIEPEPEPSEPSEPQVKMPEPPVGYRWEYRGKGWDSGMKLGLCYAYYPSMHAEKGAANSVRFKATEVDSTGADNNIHYWEAVPLTPEFAEHDRPVIDLAMKYRTRDGREVTGLSDDGQDPWRIFGYIGVDAQQWMGNGGYDYDSNGETPHPLDLIPTGEPA